MKILIIDHFFSQDIDALRYVAEKHELGVVSYDLFYRVARTIFPTSFFAYLPDADYARFVSSEYEEAHQRYLTEARVILHSLYSIFRFEAVILPSDAIFYLRAIVPVAHEIGVPVVILQKETSISPHTMTEHARAIGGSLPFISDLMFVCSERHKQFWLNTGADPQRIAVTGQPRFDFYHKPERWKALDSLGLRVRSNIPTLLFFSYDLDAYSPEGVFMPVWTNLRNETEEILVRLARQGYFNLLVKPHPQQQGIQETQERLSNLAGSTWGEAVQLLSAELDTRQLIVNSQLVVGFQTTAMFESMIAGKKPVYTFWTDPAVRFNASIMPFHEMDDELYIARSPKELEDHLLFLVGKCFVDSMPFSGLSQRVEEYLGVVDGHAAERCLILLETFVDSFQQFWRNHKVPNM